MSDFKSVASHYGAAAQRGFGQFVQKIKDELYYRSLRKRGATEAKVQSLLNGQQLKSYQQVLKAIAKDHQVAADPNRPMAERQKALGQVQGNRSIRDRMEKQVLERFEPKKPGVLDMLKKMGQPQPQQHQQQRRAQGAPRNRQEANRRKNNGGEQWP